MRFYSRTAGRYFTTKRKKKPDTKCVHAYKKHGDSLMTIRRPDDGSVQLYCKICKQYINQE